MMKGEIPEDVRPWVCGASLMALRKPNGSFRPVAFGERFVRFAARFVSISWGPQYTILEPVQVDVQARFGCETVAHTTRQWAHTFRDDPDRVLVLIDLANAIYCVSRGTVLSAVRTHFPWLAPWADTCYRHDYNLLTGSSLISSQRGVQQGGPLGPSLFALAIHPCVTEAARIAESRFQVSSSTTPSSSTMGSLQVGLRRFNRSLPPSKSAFSRLVYALPATD